MTTDKDFKEIAEAAYEVDPLWLSPPWKKGQQFPQANPEFVIVDEPVSDPVTGLQAITVAPLLPDGPDLSQIYVSFAGTNPAHHADLNSDAQTVIAGKLSATQVEQSATATAHRRY